MTETEDITPVRGVVKLSRQQDAACTKVADMLRSGAPSVTLGGLAGTGKTTVVGRLHEYVELRADQIAYCAFTGKAATVINKKLEGIGATTIHKLIYRTLERHCKQCPANSEYAQYQKHARNPKPTMAFCHGPSCGECSLSFLPKGNLPSGLRLVIVDEASMVPKSLYEHLLLYGVPIVWVGDHGQLPPVKSQAFLMEDPDIVLEKVHRTAADSPILKMAMKVRNENRLPRVGDYGDNVTVRRGGSFRVSAEELDSGSVVVLVPTNKLRRAVNKAARKQRKFDPDQPCVDDRVVCLRNNPTAGVFNGLTGRVTQFEAPWLDLEYYEMRVQMDGEDYQYQGRAAREQFLNKDTMHRVPRTEMDLWDYGYALTVHKAQGSEYTRVIVVADMSGVMRDRKKWLYTAVTRATEQLEIIYPE